MTIADISISLGFFSQRELWENKFNEENRNYAE